MENTQSCTALFLILFLFAILYRLFTNNQVSELFGINAIIVQSQHPLPTITHPNTPLYISQTPQCGYIVAPYICKIRNRYYPIPDYPTQGCSDPSKSKEIIKDRVYACSGTISTGGVFGSDATGMCGNLYHVCRHSSELEVLGMTESMCRNDVADNDNQFFATQETSPTDPIDGKVCDCYTNIRKAEIAQIPVNNPHLKTKWYQNTDGRNDIWGCAKKTPSCAPAHGAPKCGILTASIGGVYQVDQFEYWNTGSDNKHEAVHATNSDSSAGGVLCCADIVWF